MSTPLFFAQAVGRFVRTRRRGETASVFLPSVPVVLDHAARLEEQRDHVLQQVAAVDAASVFAQEEGLLAEVNRVGPGGDALEGPAFEALESQAHFDHVLFDAEQFGLHASPGSQEEQEYLGLPGLLEPGQVSELLRERQRRQVSARPVGAEAPVATHRALAAQRKELNKLVAAYARNRSVPHAVVHTDLRQACGGPTLDAASSEQVTARIEAIRRWLVGRR